jgi:hypothetical protein
MYLIVHNRSQKCNMFFCVIGKDLPKCTGSHPRSRSENLKSPNWNYLSSWRRWERELHLFFVKNFPSYSFYNKKYRSKGNCKANTSLCEIRLHDRRRMNLRLQVRISSIGRGRSYISLLNVNIFVRLEIPTAVAITTTTLGSYCSV